MMVANVVLGCFLMGYNICVFNSCQNIISKFNGWITDEEKSLKVGLITSILPFGALLGSYYCNLLGNYIKNTRK
jgi:hypothetical protein